MICGAAGYDLEREAFNTQEQLLCSLLVVVGALLWGHVIGTWVSVINNVNPDLKWFRNTMDSLNTFMSIHGLPSEMRTRLREYFQQTRHMHRGQERKHLMRLMSPQLQGEVALYMNQEWLKNVPFLQGVERELLVLVSRIHIPSHPSLVSFCSPDPPLSSPHRSPPTCSPPSSLPAS